MRQFQTHKYSSISSYKQTQLYVNKLTRQAKSYTCLSPNTLQDRQMCHHLYLSAPEEVQEINYFLKEEEEAGCCASLCFLSSQGKSNKDTPRNSWESGKDTNPRESTYCQSSFIGHCEGWRTRTILTWLNFTWFTDRSGGAFYWTV